MFSAMERPREDLLQTERVPILEVRSDKQLQISCKLVVELLRANRSLSELCTHQQAVFIPIAFDRVFHVGIGEDLAKNLNRKLFDGGGEAALDMHLELLRRFSNGNGGARSPSILLQSCQLGRA